MTKSISKNFGTNVVDITNPRFRGTYTAIKRITRMSRPRVKFHWGSDYTFVALLSCGLIPLPSHMVVSGIRADNIDYGGFLALIAHEFGHLYLGNVFLLNFIRAVTLGPMALSLWIGQLTPFGVKIPKKWPGLYTPHQVFSWTMALISIPMALVLFYLSLGLTIILFSIAQYFEEYTADSNAYAIQSTGRHLGSALEYLHLQKTSPGGAKSPYNWFWIMESNDPKILYNAIAWYPSLVRRIRALQWLEK